MNFRDASHSKDKAHLQKRHPGYSYIFSSDSSRTWQRSKYIFFLRKLRINFQSKFKVLSSYSHLGTQEMITELGNLLEKSINNFPANNVISGIISSLQYHKVLGSQNKY